MTQHSRREFLGLTLPATVALGAGLSALRPDTATAAEAQLPPAAATVNQHPGAGRFALELDQQHAGWLESADGGDATGEVVLEKAGIDGIQRKHVAGLKYDEIVLTCGTGMSKAFYDWIKASFDRRPVPKNGAIVAFDLNNKPLSRLEWSNGVLTEVGFPALDASSKDRAVMTVKIAPALTQMVAPHAATQMVPAIQKGMPPRWLLSNFRLQIAGCPTACAHVNAVDAVVLKYVQAGMPLGVARTTQVVPRQFEAPDLSLTTAEADSGEFFNWYEDFLIKGNNSAAKEKTGTLEYLGPDLKPLFTLNFSGLGIFKFAPEKMTAGTPTIRRVKAEMYCDSVNLSYSAIA